MSEQEFYGGKEQLENRTEGTEGYDGVGPAKWFELGEQGGGREKVKNRLPEARKGITPRARNMGKRFDQVASILDGAASGAAFVLEHRKSRE